MKHKSIETATRSGARRHLRRELATFTTPSHVEDLLASLREGDDATAEEMRGILLGNLQRCA